jgi:heme oxygenase
MPDGNPIDPSTLNGPPKPPERQVREPRAQDPHNDLHARFRASTRSIHERVEQQMDLERASTSILAYRSILRDMLRLHRPIERRLGALALETAGIDFEARRKVVWLIADLIDLGADPSAADAIEAFALATFAAFESCLGESRDSLATKPPTRDAAESGPGSPD